MGTEGAARPDPFGLVGQTLVGRFRIDEEVAEGGFAVVYRAQQLALDRAVAVKVLKTPGALTGADRADFQRSFEEEGRTIARLKHPHIVEVYDFGVTERETGGPLLWLALEWLAGKTLEQMLEGERGQGQGGRRPMEPARALELLRPALRTIGFAHGQRVVHRDLKPANIFLAEEGGTTTLKVLDFGIAKIMSAGQQEGEPPAEQGGAQAARARTTRGLPAFSPEYAAPEQIAHGRTGPWTDVHALGLILTEMVTGRPPYGDACGDLFSAVLSDLRPTPRAKGVDVGTWEPVLARALAQRPVDRYPDAGALLAALDSSGGTTRVGLGDTQIAAVAPPRAAAGPTTAVPPPTVQRVHHSPRGRRARALAAALLAAVVVVLLGVWVARPTRPGAGLGALAARSVAVLPLADRTGRPDAAWLSTALAELLAGALGAGERLRVVSVESGGRAMADLGVDVNVPLRSEDRDRLGRYLATDLLLAGSYSAGEGRTLRLSVRFLEPTRGQLVAVEEVAPEEDPFGLAARVGARLREALALGALSEGQVRSSRQVLPAGADAARYYAEGLARRRRLDAAGALEALRKVALAEPDFAPGQLMLAVAAREAGVTAEQRQAAARAVAHADGLTREQTLRAQAEDHEASKRFTEAADVYRALFAFYPDSIDYGVRLSSLLVQAGRPPEALAPLATLRKQASSIAEDPRIDVQEAWVRSQSGELKKVVELAGRAAARARTLGIRSLLAQARRLEAGALLALGQTQEGLRAVDEAIGVFESDGDSPSLSRALLTKASGLIGTGDLVGSSALFERVRREQHALGNTLLEARAVGSLASNRARQGELVGARDLAAQAVQLLARTEDRNALVDAMVPLSDMEARLGNAAAANATADQALAIARSIGNSTSIAYALSYVAMNQMDAGDPARARRSFEEVARLRDATGNRRQRADDAVSLSSALRELGLFDEARAKAEESRRINLEIGSDDREPRYFLALLDLDVGRPADAERTLQPLLKDAEASGAIAETARVRAQLVRALLEQDRLPEARREAERVQSMLMSLSDSGIRLSSTIVLARLRARSGQPSEARRMLEATREEAAAKGLVLVALNARLVLARLQPQEATRRQALEGVARQARKLGLLRLLGEVNRKTL